MDNSKDRFISKNIKIALYGDSGVGKTAVALRWGTGVFDETYQSTLGADFESKTIVNADAKLSLNLQIWDIDGQKKFEGMLPLYFRDTKWVVLVFSVTDRRSFSNLPYYLENARYYADPSAVYVILANKIDLVSERQVSDAEARAFSAEQHTVYIETSVKDPSKLQWLDKEILRTESLSLNKKRARVLDPSLSIFGGTGKQEGFEEEKAACARPETRSPRLFRSETKIPAATDKSNLEAKGMPLG